MWRIAQVVKRGLKHEGGGVENRSGHRTAVVRTPGGVLYHISDLSYYESYYASGPVPDLSKNRNGPYPFVRKGQWVIIDIAGATRDHGLNPEPKRWTLLKEYERVLGHCLANTCGVSHVAQPGVMKLVRDYMDDTFGPTSRDEWLTFEARKVALCRQGVTPNYLERLKSYYLLGQAWLTSRSFT